MPAIKRKGKLPFDPKIFLAKVGEGKTISKYRKDQIVFSQGEVADAVFYNGIHERTLHLEAGFLRMVGTMAVYLFERRCRNCERFHANASSGQRAMIASRNVP